MLRVRVGTSGSDDVKVHAPYDAMALAERVAQLPGAV